MFLIVFLTTAVLLIFYYAFKPSKYWTGKNVKEKTPCLFGATWKIFVGKQTHVDMFKTNYDAFPNSRYVGMYQLTYPQLLLRDPELIKQITVKDFDHFSEHYPFIPINADELWSTNLLYLTGQKWKDMRSKLSPVFTSNKMRIFFNLISENGEQFIEHFLNKNQELISVQLKDIFTRFTNDVIANIAFGVKCDSLVDTNNEFYKRSNELVNFSNGFKGLKFLAYALFPKLCSFLKVPVFAKTERDFFINLMKETIKTREERGIVRPDLVHLLLEARKHGFKPEEKTTIDTGFATVEESEITKAKDLEITDFDITAQAVVFLLAGFSSVASLMCFMGYELAVNPDIQNRLQQEIDKTRKECDGKVTYEALLKMSYLDMVVSETLRKWPNILATDRMCVKPYTIQPVLPDESPVMLEKGEIISLPIIALHRDPNYFPDPEKFDPERFSEENREKIVPYSYIPFGVGPRNCIGSRFALLETKILFFHLLTNFEVVPNEKSQIPVQISRRQFHLGSDDGFCFDLKRRVN